MDGETDGWTDGWMDRSIHRSMEDDSKEGIDCDDWNKKKHTNDTLKDQIRYRGNQEQRQAKKEMIQHLQKMVLDQTQMQIDLHVRGRNQ